MADNLKFPEYFKSLNSSLIFSLISAASVLRKEQLLRKALLFCKKNNVSTTKIYETLLQTYLFAGFPSALNSLKIFSEYFPSNNRQISSAPIKVLRKKGKIINKKIYGDKQGKLLANIKIFSPELSEWLLIEGYGKVLSRRGMQLKERELSIITILSVQKFESQLYSHINGAYKLGVPIKEIYESIEILNKIGEKQLSKFGLNVLRKYKIRNGILLK